MTELNDLISGDILPHVYTQSYEKKPQIEGVKILDIAAYLAEEGDFAEIIRLDESGNLLLFPEFKLRQVNRTQVFPGAIKAWHVHRNQAEVWYVPPRFQLTIGVWDVRKDSQSSGVAQKVVLGGGQSKLLYLPPGVAHGMCNHSAENVDMFYFMNQHFSATTPDEQRIHWNHLGAEFWLPERD